LNDVSNAIDRWTGVGPECGVFSVQSQADIDALLAAGILTQTRPPRPSGAGVGTGGNSAAKRQKLVKLPPWPDGEADDATVGDQSEEDASALLAVAEEPGPDAWQASLAGPPEEETSVDAELLPSVQRGGFPNYIRFAPGTEVPTKGWSALSGVELQQPFVGLILRLTKDSARHFSGGDGTANISIPVGVARTFRFGVLPKSGRPRAEFGLRARYYSDTLVVERVAETNVMAYGYLPGEKGHGDLRLLVPTAVRRIAEEVRREGQVLPSAGDLFLLEWPNSETESFGLTFLHPETAAADRARHLYKRAEQSQALFGAACWLPLGTVPSWQ
jgi:hypothetical protein